MNRIIISFCIFFFSITSNASAQNYTKHTVAKGETVTQLAARYKVTPYDIYKLNPDSQNGIKENDVILIPSAGSATPTAGTPKATASARTHTAEPKETLYSISRKYNVSVADLQSLNADVLKDGLKVGQTIRIPASGVASETVESKSEPVETKTAPSAGNGVYHIVAPKETKFGIAKKYGMTVAELERKNPDIVSNLPIGYRLTISGTPATQATAKQQPVTEIAEPETVKTETTKTAHFKGFANYEVKPKETMFSLSQMFDITQEELLMLNPTLKEGVKVGMILKVPGKGSMVLQSSPSSNGKFADLTKSIKNTEKKQLVLLLPFNATKIQGDTLKTMAIRLKKDAFLNMTLDFYSGALMAIDSAKTLGLNIDIKILDSEESKVSSNVANLVTNNNLLKADAVIGPFYQQYVEKVAEMLSKNNVAVISPLSKETGKAFPNLYQSMPPSEFTKSAMFDFMKSKNGNILVVSDPKRLSNKEFITLSSTVGSEAWNSRDLKSRPH